MMAEEQTDSADKFGFTESGRESSFISKYTNIRMCLSNDMNQLELDGV